MIEQILITIVLLVISYAITSRLFPSRNKVKFIPLPPPINQPLFTTDLVISKGTKWYTYNEFFGQPTIKEINSPLRRER